MGVYIKGVTKSQLMKIIINSTEFMPDDFEVIEVNTPHGRLIDAEDLLEGTLDHDLISTHIIYNSPTVIEAEVE